jgi:hypothetical protein
MKKNNLILAFVAILTLAVMSWGLQISPSAGTQIPQSQTHVPIEVTSLYGRAVRVLSRCQ